MELQELSDIRAQAALNSDYFEVTGLCTRVGTCGRTAPCWVQDMWEDGEYCDASNAPSINLLTISHSLLHVLDPDPPSPAALL